ncbi:transposase [Mycoplasmopsis bovis]|uniref:transposase n=1 Tax=Mycoplasmopsis bovis TaxID=28903 RepID=UPI001BDE773C|nr:transposase [Mycoplasmopsis bovis]MBT1320014.1 transposase [Mycoplasmopsis bovis]UJB24392.1 transposase [Mycoplasmopsis bovis]
MAIPVEIRQVERPKNTVIKNYFGKFKVVKRTSKYVNGKAIPKDLAIVGEIVDYKFVPFETPIPVGTRSKKNKEKTDIKDYGNIAIFTKNSNDILEKLLTHFDSSTAYKLYVIAVLRCAYPKAVNRDLKFYYETSFMSELFKKVGLSESLLPDFFEKTGRAYSNIHNFMLDRINEFKGRVQIIDGTLKSYNSDEATFSQLSRKGKVKDSENFTLLYTCDLYTKEPIYHRPYQGNMLDSTIFEDFLENVPSTGEILVADKGFRTKAITELLEQNKNVNYLFSLKRNTTLIRAEKLDENLAPVKIKDKQLLGSKKQIDGKFFYLFKDLEIAGKESVGNYQKHLKRNTFNIDEFNKNNQFFGVIVFESNVDLSLEDVYTLYDQRWEIEEMFNFYKNILEPSKTRVHSEMKVYTTEFINYLSLIIATKVKNNLIKLNLHQNYSFRQIIEYLRSYKVEVINDTEWKKRKVLKYVQDIVELLEI